VCVILGVCVCHALSYVAAEVTLVLLELLKSCCSTVAVLLQLPLLLLLVLLLFIV
jgi:hypothetical protein